MRGNFLGKCNSTFILKPSILTFKKIFMKKNFRNTLGTVTFTSIFLLFNFYFSSCKAHIISPINNPNLGIQASELIQAGSAVQFVCTGNISCDTSGTHTVGGGTKMVQQFIITNTIPANAVFQIKILNPNGETIKFKCVSTDKE
jgi:hypothetical protein